MKLLIVDDEPLAHKVLEGYIEKLEGLSVVGNCYDGISTLNFLNSHDVDLILLDIQMPDITGLELAESLKNRKVKIVFTTAYTEYALASFDYDQVVDYLHKPIRITRFIKAINRVKKQLQLEVGFKDKTLIERPVEEKKEAASFINLKDNKTIYKIQFKDIKYIQSWGNYLKFFLTSEDIKIVRRTIKSMEGLLPETQFQRIHKSYIVNVSCVKSIMGNQAMIGDQYIPIGQSYLLQAKSKILGIS